MIGECGLAAPKPDPVLIRGLRRAHALASGLGWQMRTGAVDGAACKAPSSAYDRKVCRLAFLAPALQKAILEGRQPSGLTLQRLLDAPLPLDWDEQLMMIGAPI